MNVQQLKELVENLLSYENINGVQNITNSVRDNFSNLASNPHHPDIQLSARNSIDQLIQVLVRLENIFTPAQKEIMAEIGASDFFQSNIGDTVLASMRDNAMTPATTLQIIEDYRSRREQYLAVLARLASDLNLVHVESYKPTAGAADLGFTIPREIFDNEFDGLIKRLNDIRRIIRTFSEVATGHVERVKVKSISTTDPLFFLTTCLPTALLIGKAFSWALDQWKKVEEIRKLRAETKKLSAFTDEEIDTFFGGKIQHTIEEAVKEETAKLFNQVELGRPAELRNAVEITLRDILSMVERGVTLQIKFDPTTIHTEEDEESNIAEGEQISAEQLTALSKELKFPPPSQDPILSLPSNKELDNSASSE